MHPQQSFSYVLNSRPTLLFLPLPPSHQSRKAYSRFVTRMMANHQRLLNGLVVYPHEGVGAVDGACNIAVQIIQTV